MQLLQCPSEKGQGDVTPLATDRQLAATLHSNEMSFTVKSQPVIFHYI